MSCLTTGATRTKLPPSRCNNTYLVDTLCFAESLDSAIDMPNSWPAAECLEVGLKMPKHAHKQTLRVRLAVWLSIMALSSRHPCNHKAATGNVPHATGNAPLVGVMRVR
ncbi:hypothetical protein ACLKA7_016374 [Drosophila subpalustris]